MSPWGYVSKYTTICRFQTKELKFFVGLTLSPDFISFSKPNFKETARLSVHYAAKILATPSLKQVFWVGHWGSLRLEPALTTDLYNII